MGRYNKNRNKNRKKNRKERKNKSRKPEVETKKLSPLATRLLQDSTSGDHPLHAWPTSLVLLLVAWKDEMDTWEVEVNFVLKGLHDHYFVQKALCEAIHIFRTELVANGADDNLLDMSLVAMGREKKMARNLYEDIQSTCVYLDSPDVLNFVGTMAKTIELFVDYTGGPMKDVVKAVAQTSKYVDYETTILEEPNDGRCKKCMVEFCRCPGFRCEKKEAELKCGCTGFCQGCVFNHSRETATRCCDDEFCTHREFRCQACFQLLHFNTRSNLDTSMTLWDPVDEGESD